MVIHRSPYSYLFLNQVPEVQRREQQAGDLHTYSRHVDGLRLGDVPHPPGREIARRRDFRHVRDASRSFISGGSPA